MVSCQHGAPMIVSLSHIVQHNSSNSPLLHDKQGMSGRAGYCMTNKICLVALGIIRVPPSRSPASVVSHSHGKQTVPICKTRVWHRHRACCLMTVVLNPARWQVKKCLIKGSNGSHDSTLTTRPAHLER